MSRGPIKEIHREQLKLIGNACRELRFSLNKTQKQVAIDIGVRPNDVAVFERGNNNSAIILYWYINHGLKGLYL